MKRIVLSVFASVAAVTIVAGCNSAVTPGGTTPPAAGPAPSTVRPSTSSSPETATAAPDQETPLRITITVDGTEFTGTLDDNAAARTLLAQLPVEVDMTDHGGVEKTGRLPAPLSLDGLPSGADPDVGDIGYYAPGQDLVLYYGNQGYYEGIVVLGRFDSSVDTLAVMAGDVSVSVRASD